MLHRTGFIWIIVVLVALRILGMVLVPLTDTTEARYAEIARLMVTTNDWITPWFKPDVPFWGKPPLAFWMEALSFKAFGINEFAVRLPSLLATLATSWVIWRFALLTGTTRTARNAVLIYITTALAYVASGAVMTDPFLTLGVTWSLAAFYLAPTAPRWYWRYGFFLGLAIGLLAKGPLALVLTFAPIVIWSFIHRSGTAQCHIKALPWLKGSLLTLLIGLPWYIAAELKTPGFLNYFIIGEHFMRFIQPGWGGGGGRDLYGSAHRHPKGTIWLQWLMASFPWGLIAIGLLLGKMVAAQDRKTLKTTAASPLHSYLLSWALFTPLFFTPAGNVLCTYLLPALPALALILAMGSGDSGQKQTHGKRRLCCPVPRSIALFGRIRICHAATRQRQNRKRIGGLRKQSIGQCQR
ncbi:ArnT family glycosyltransferase [Thiolapillus sp.]|uniref:ArnT family glycosyltransferase n=3 Tax=Thiolapillus sp. TaxID=2017437 RepID=UPI003AF974D8